MFQFNSIRFKISILYVVILGATLVTYSALLYFSLHVILYHDLDIELEAKAQEVKNIVDAYVEVLGPGEPAFLQAVRQTIELEKKGLAAENVNAAEARWLQNMDRFNLRQNYIRVVDLTGNPIARSHDFTSDIAALFFKAFKNKGAGGPFYANIRVEDRLLRLIRVPYHFRGGHHGIIEIGASINPAIYTLHSRLLSILVSIPIVLALTSFVGSVLAFRILKPVLEITKTAEKITHEDLTVRVQAHQTDAEIKYLVNAFNDMIARLEKSFKYIGEFSSHVAHELKTPLAIVRGESEVALRSEYTEKEYRAAVKANLEEIERMTKVVDDMLLLTKLEYETEVFKFDRFNLAELLRDISEQSKILAAPKSITVETDYPAEEIAIQGDHLHLRRLFFNLIDNAIKFSPPGSLIQIKMEARNGTVKVSVADYGSGIAEPDLPKIFDKFFHQDRTARKRASGNGLGLSLALSIAKAHQGDIEVQSRLQKGSTFTVILPMS